MTKTTSDRVKDTMKCGLILCQIEKDYAAAIPFLLEAARDPKYTAGAKWWAAVCFEALGKDQEALDAYRTCVHLEPSIPDGYVAMSSILMRLGRVDEANQAQAKANYVRNINLPESD